MFCIIITVICMMFITNLKTKAINVSYITYYIFIYMFIFNNIYIYIYNKVKFVRI